MSSFLFVSNTEVLIGPASHGNEEWKHCHELNAAACSCRESYKETNGTLAAGGPSGPPDQNSGAHVCVVSLSSTIREEARVSS